MPAQAVVLSAAAVAKVKEFAAAHPEAAGKMLRVYVQGGGRVEYEYGFTFDAPHAGDEVLQQNDIQVVVDRLSLMYLDGSTIDFVEDLRGSGFVVDNPNLPPLLRDPVAARIHAILKDRINPGIAAHGGWVQLIDYEEGRVLLKLGGGCQGCGMADVTLRQGIERILREEVPEIVEILDTTDHASGTNPYYTGAH